MPGNKGRRKDHTLAQKEKDRDSNGQKYRSCGTRALHLPPALALFVLLEHLPLMGHLANASGKGKSQLTGQGLRRPRHTLLRLCGQY